MINRRNEYSNVETDEVIATSSLYFKSDVALNVHSFFTRIEYQEMTANEENYFSKTLWFYEHCLQVYSASI
jgi:hypothetical protein